MSMLRGVLESQAPPKFTATETINTLSNRLANATLLEDRRGAIQGLRSFAKEYPASVASGALRQLISTLSKGVDDVDTSKVVLETLLMLFSPNEDSPEASSDIALWLSDEFTTRQDNITILLDLLENNDFYSRLYALQLLSAISSARPERTQECILSAPLGITRLVSILDDSREAVRSAGLLLLNDITQGSTELQKVVAFENAFDRVLNLIKIDGSLAEGGILVQDCLSLLANLLNLNAANQSMFRETGFVSQLSKLLAQDTQPKAAENGDDFAPNPHKERNVWGFLAVLRLFLIQGNPGTPANQAAFEKNSILKLVLDLAFDDSFGPPIRAEALKTCADIIKGNSKIQERFAHNKVSLPPNVNANGAAQNTVNGDAKAYIIDALLNLALSENSASMFDVRFAASQCIQAYFYGHMPIRQHFLRRAIEGHTSGDDETSNILSILISGPRSFQSPDPYRLWFAAQLVHELLFENSEAKNMTMAVAEGDSEKGEEVVSCIQAMAGNLTAALQTAEDDRVCAGYLMVLCTWLFEDASAVNDFLTEGSVIQSLIQATSRDEKDREMLQGLCAVLLGILYEFSTKDSPVTRRTLQPILMQGLGREYYVSRITKLREHPYVRDFEVLPQDLSSAEPGMLPEVYFDQTFVNFIKDNFTRLTRAIDKDPGIEISKEGEGIDRDLVDSLRSQISDKTDALQAAESNVLNVQGKLGQEQADHRRSQEKFNAELARIKNINESLQKEHESENEKTGAEHRAMIQDLRQQHQRQMQELTEQKDRDSKAAARSLEATEEQHRNELSSLQKHIRELEQTAMESNETIETLQRTNNTVSETVKQRDQQLEGMKESKHVLEEKIELDTVNARDLETRIKGLETRLKEANKHETELQVELNKKEEERQGAQTELDDLLVVLGDLEEKRERDKAKLKELGAEVSEPEDGDEEDEDGEEEDDGDEGEEDEEETEAREKTKDDGDNSHEADRSTQQDERKANHARDQSVD